VGESVVVSVTIPVTLLRWARESNIVLSRVLREALDKLRGGSDLAKVETELRSHQEQVRILEAARERLLEEWRIEEASQATARARLETIHRIADTFYANGRDDGRQFGRTHNLNWLKARIADSPSLRGTRPEEILSLVLDLRQEYRPGDVQGERAA
jgi:flagellar biosynthesis/type III secretory pathway protein FliH